MRSVTRIAFFLPWFVACAAAPAPCPSAKPPAPCPNVAAVDASAPADAANAIGVDELKDELLKRITAHDAAGVFAILGPGLREALPMEKLGGWVDGITSTKGKLVGSTRVAGVGGPRKGVYRVQAERGEWQLEIAVSDDGHILGLKFGDPPSADPAVVQSTLPIGLPFRGKWFVFWGGDRLEVNQHVSHRSQRRAADLLMTGDDGKTFHGDGKKNTDYLAYGQDVLAVADGTVETAIDGVPENAPGAANPYFALGNIVIVKHGPTLYSAYAHMQPGKLRVKPGQAVKRGAVLGLCGNSGNTSEPHLHFQLQDAPLFEASFGVEAVFRGVNVTRDGKTEKSDAYTFLKGDRIEAAPNR